MNAYKLLSYCYYLPVLLFEIVLEANVALDGAGLDARHLQGGLFAPRHVEPVARQLQLTQARVHVADGVGARDAADLRVRIDAGQSDDQRVVELVHLLQHACQTQLGYVVVAARRMVDGSLQALDRVGEVALDLEVVARHAQVHPRRGILDEYFQPKNVTKKYVER